MSLWQEVLGQEEACPFLKSQFREGQISHAYLFSGPEGVGKKLVAKILATTLNCKDEGCGVCPSCLKILKGVHPDVLLIEPEGNYVSIEKIREVKTQAFFRPVEARLKFFLIDEAEKLTSQAANALLKILEEPPSYLIFILISSSPISLPPTIVSRCQLIRFKPFSRKLIADYLVKNFGVTKDKARLVANLSQGNLGQALRLKDSSGSFKKREAVLKTLLNLRDFDLLDLLESVSGQLIEENKKEVAQFKLHQKKEEKELSLAGFLNRPQEKELKEKQQRELKRKEEESFLEILVFVKSWYWDLLILKVSMVNSFFRGELPLINLDKFETLKNSSQKFTIGEITRALAIVGKTRKYLQAKVNKALCLEGMFLELGGLGA